MGACFSSSSSSSSSTVNNVRVVHLNGMVEDFQHPVTVNQVTCNKTSKHVLCTPAQLLSIGVKPLPATSQLEAGRIYILLPHSAFLSHDVSSLDLASIVKKLTATAKSSTPSLHQQQDRIDHVMKRSWKPVLDPIRERSFNRMSESDLQEHNHLEADLRQNLGMPMHAQVEMLSS